MPKTDIYLPNKAEDAAEKVAAQGRATQRFITGGTSAPAAPVAAPAASSLHDGIDYLTHKTPFGRVNDILGSAPKK